MSLAKAKTKVTPKAKAKSKAGGKKQTRNPAKTSAQSSSQKKSAAQKIAVTKSGSRKLQKTSLPQTARSHLNTQARDLALALQAFSEAQLLEALRRREIDARVGEDYCTFRTAGPRVCTLIRAGNYIPGVPRESAFAELVWRAPDKSWEAAVEGRVAGAMFAADTNVADSARATGYAIANARVGLTQRSGTLTFTEFLRVDNMFDRAYVGSVIVNQSAATPQYYESAPGRGYTIGVKVTGQF